jgi:hypothetical protein
MRTHFASVSSGLFWNHASSLWSPRTRNGIVSPPGANAVGGQRGARPAREHTHGQHSKTITLSRMHVRVQRLLNKCQRTPISLSRAHTKHRRSGGRRAARRCRSGVSHATLALPVGQGASPTTAAHGAGGRELHAGATTRDELGDDAKHGRRTVCGPQLAAGMAAVLNRPGEGFP